MFRLSFGIGNWIVESKLRTDCRPVRCRSGLCEFWRCQAASRTRVHAFYFVYFRDIASVVAPARKLSKHTGCKYDEFKMYCSYFVQTSARDLDIYCVSEIVSQYIQPFIKLQTFPEMLYIQGRFKSSLLFVLSVVLLLYSYFWSLIQKTRHFQNNTYMSRQKM